MAALLNVKQREAFLCLPLPQAAEGRGEGSDFRDISDHVKRIDRAVDRMQEMPTSAMRIHLTLVTVRHDERVKRLAGWGAILAVPSMVFSLYGVNFNSIPELGVGTRQSRHAGRRDRKLCDSVPEA